MSSQEEPIFLVTPNQHDRINEICREIGRYPSWHDFMAEAVELFVTWWTNPEKTQALVAKMWPDVTDEMKENTKENFPGFYDLMPNESGQKPVSLKFDASSVNERPLYRLSQGQFEEIKQICIDIERYPSWHDFMTEAVELFVTWWSDPMKAIGLVAKMWPDVTDEMKKNTKRMDINFYNQMESANKDANSNKIIEGQREPASLPEPDLRNVGRTSAETLDEPLVMQQRTQLREMKDDLQHTHAYIKDLENKSTKEFDLLEYDGYPLIWSFYSRFFPVKLVVSVLAHIMYQDKTDYAHLRKLEKRVEVIAPTYSEELRHSEWENKSARNEKVSTGLPVPSLGPKDTKRKDVLKFEASKSRFVQHYVGKRRKDTNYFSGALIAMGLVHVTDEKNPKIMLSKRGVDFYLIPNPIIHNKTYTRSISEKEKDFILEKIVPEFKLENILVDAVMKTIRDRRMKSAEERSIETAELDKLFEDEILSWVSKNKEAAKKYRIDNLKNVKDKDLIAKKKAELMRTGFRVATMGRLAEIRAITWMINKEGSSVYSLPSTPSTKVVAT